MKPCVAVALSGGVDSLVAAHLLKEQGLKVIGLHFITGFESNNLQPENQPHERPLRRISADFLKTDTEKKLKSISQQLDIPLIVLDLREEFERYVVSKFIETYRLGKTPNPCLLCNRSVKFGRLWEYAQKLGANKLATGHYARIKKGPGGQYHLFKAADRVKDQSYFLGFINRDQLSRSCFPLGEKSKPEVRYIAEKNGLVPLTKRESQDVCFIKNVSYGKFLSRYFSPRPGIVEDTSGKVIGQHKGLHLFTVGQRRGINCPAPEPYYVVKIDIKRNCLVVGFKHELNQQECRVEAINWIHHHPFDSMAVHTRVRYRHHAAASTVIPLDRHTALVRFDKPQEAVAPGQGAVFYLNDEVIGAGWIAGVTR